MLLMCVLTCYKLTTLFLLQSDEQMYIALLKPEKNTRETVMCGGHYSRALYSNSVTNSNATINRKHHNHSSSGGSSSALQQANHHNLNNNHNHHLNQHTPISNEASSNSSELDTTTTTAAMNNHNEACKQLSSKDSQLESTSVGGESGILEATSLYNMTNSQQNSGGGSTGALVSSQGIINNANNNSTAHNYYRPNTHKRFRSSGSTVSERALRSLSACSARSNGGEVAGHSIGNGRREVWPGKLRSPQFHRRQVSLTIASSPLCSRGESPSPPEETSPLTSPVSLLISSPPSTPPPSPSTTNTNFMPNCISSTSSTRPLLTLSASPPPPSPSNGHSFAPSSKGVALPSSTSANMFPSTTLNGDLGMMNENSLSSYTIDLALEQLNKQRSSSHSTSSPALTSTTINHSSPNENGDFSFSTMNGVGSKCSNSTKASGIKTHHTKAVLENGHERWPSVRLEENVGNHVSVKTNGNITHKKR